MSIPMTLPDISAELRYKAEKLRPELGEMHDLSSSDGKGYPITQLLAIAFIDAVNDEWDRWAEIWRASGSGDLVNRAIELAKAAHCSVSDEGHRLITSLNSGEKPCVAVIRGRDMQGVPDREVLAFQYCFVCAQPLWVRYLHEADLQILEEKKDIAS